MNFIKKLGLFGAITLLVAFIAGIFGWFANIFVLFSMLDSNIASASFIIRVIGVFVFPLGALLGLFF